MRMLKIYVDGTIEEVDITPEEAIPDGFIERVAVGDTSVDPPQRFEDAALIVDENGIAKGLPVNRRASVLYGALLHQGLIHGNVFLVGECGDGPDVDFCPLPGTYTVQSVEKFTARSVEKFTAQYADDDVQPPA